MSSCTILFEETMLTGQVLVHWDLLGTVLGEKNTLFRCELKTGTVLVGLMIPQDLVVLQLQKEPRYRGPKTVNI